MNGSYTIEPVDNVVVGDHVVRGSDLAYVGVVEEVDGDWCEVSFKDLEGVTICSRECHIIELYKIFFRYPNCDTTCDEEIRVEVEKDHYFDVIELL